MTSQWLNQKVEQTQRIIDSLIQWDASDDMEDEAWRAEALSHHFATLRHLDQMLRGTGGTR